MGIFGGADLISGGSAVLGYIGARQANDAAHDMAADQFAWSLDADSKKYRRAVQDLRAAGLNPLLAVGGGVHGGTPSGGSTPSFQNPFAGVAGAMSLKRLDAEIDLLRAQEKREKSQSDLNDNQGAKVIQDRKATMIDNIYRELGLPGAAVNSAWSSSKIGQASAAIGKFIKDISPLTPSMSQSHHTR